MVLPDPFRGMKACRNSTETQQSGHTPRFRPEIKDGSNVKDGLSESLRIMRDNVAFVVPVSSNVLF